MSHATASPQESALLVGLALPGMPRWEAGESLEELARLADTATLAVADRVLQSRPRVDATWYIGKGKAQELKELSESAGADMIIFDNELSPAQMRNLEKLTEMRILDRSAIILDIFSRHARTRSAQVQVELAQLKYLLPRLTRYWSHLSRQAGGGAIRGMGAAGVRGPGETQLEIDRRLIRGRIGALQSELNRIGSQMATARKGRGDLFRVALVGYTNAGKSTLMRALSGEDVLVQDRLFATLDSTTRSVGLEGGPRILLTDTVGFIRRLPHHLFASFRATLAEAAEADLLLHVVDRSHPQYAAQMATVESVLADLGVEDRPLLEVHNKIDRMDEGEDTSRRRTATWPCRPSPAPASTSCAGGSAPTARSRRSPSTSASPRPRAGCCRSCTSRERSWSSPTTRTRSTCGCASAATGPSAGAWSASGPPRPAPSPPAFPLSRNRRSAAARTPTAPASPRRCDGCGPAPGARGRRAAASR